MEFDYQPTLKGQLLELRPLRHGDFEALFRVASDPLIWTQHPNSDRYKPEIFDEFFRDALQSGGALIATDALTGAVIGSSRFHGHDPKTREVEIGWSFLARSCWGGYYNGEMKRLMLAHAFRFVDSVLFLVGPENRRSQRALEKIGAVYEGRRDDAPRGARVCYRIKAAWA